MKDEKLYLRAQARRHADTAVLEQPDEMPKSYRLRDIPLVEQVIDVVAGMSDNYALRVHDQIFRP